MKIEVLGTERRRRWSLQDKLQIVEETLQPGVTVSEVARRHGLAPSVVFTWRRLAREGRLGDAGPAFMPVEIAPVPVQTTPVASPPRRTGLIEIVLGRGRRIRVDRDVDAEALRRARTASSILSWSISIRPLYHAAAEIPRSSADAYDGFKR